MVKSKYKMYTKRIISTVILLQVALIFNKEKPSLHYLNLDLDLDEGIEIIDEKEVISPEINHMKINTGIFNSEECLVSTTEAKELLSSRYNITEEKVIDKNLRFALGKCHPLLFIPGLYSTRLVLAINCKKFFRKHKPSIEMRLYCGESICTDRNNEYEEHVLWPALMDSPFTLLVGEWNKHSACLGYFLQYYNQKTECPKYHKKTAKFLGDEATEAICLYDEAVKITYYGGTKKTIKNSQCGIAAVKNLVSVGNRNIKESWVNSGTPRAFQDMYDRYYQMGYTEGFSMGGLPYDFRRFVDTNEYFQKALTHQIERLYSNTGKPVVLIAHSYGCLNVLNGLIKTNPSIKKQVKKFVAIAPPFAGSPKIIQFFLYGTSQFDTTISIAGYDLLHVAFDVFGQEMAFPSLPVAMELRPNPILFSLFNNNEYKLFTNAIKERLFLEKNCRVRDCDAEFVERFSKNFTLVFNHTFPSFMDSECNMREYFQNKKEMERYLDFISDNSGNVPFMFPCRNEIFNTVSCPTMIFKKTNEDENASTIETNHCFEDIIEEKALYNHQCEKTPKNCLDNIFHDTGPMPYNDTKLFELIRNFEMHYASEFNVNETMWSEFFDRHEDYLGKTVAMMNYHKQISMTRDIPPPTVDTAVIYSTFVPTTTSFVFDAGNGNKQNFDYRDILMKGGDGTVPNWSSLLIGMKWLYEKSMLNLTQKIELVEYCSKLSHKDSRYRYNKTEGNQGFYAIGCSCIDSDGRYIVEKIKSKTCQHSTMISDPALIRFVENYLISEELIQDVTKDRKKAVKNYDEKYDYNMECNQDLYELFVKESGSLERLER